MGELTQGDIDRLRAARARMRARTAASAEPIYAAFDGNGRPIPGLWAWSARILGLTLAERARDGSTLLGEHGRLISRPDYEAALIAIGGRLPDELQPEAPR